MLKEGQLALIRAETTDTGAKIFVKSKIISDFFKDLSGGKRQVASTHPGWEGDVYTLDSGDEEFGKFRLIGGQLIDSSNRPNLSFFRYVGIDEGKTFNLNEGLISKSQLKKWEEEASQALIDFYKTYLKDDSFELVMTLRRILTTKEESNV